MATSITEPEKLDGLRNYEAEAARAAIMQQILSAPPAGPMPAEPPKPPPDTRTKYEIELAKQPMEVHHPRIPFNPYPDKPLTGKTESVVHLAPAAESAPVPVLQTATLQLLQMQMGIIERQDAEIKELRGKLARVRKPVHR